jgi:GT2 family glycosyltransferase
MKKCVYILLPVYNRREITRDFIDCLGTQTWQNYHLVLIDDGSTDGTGQMVRERVENLTVIRGNGDWWWAGSLQQGFNFLKKKGISSDDCVLITNNDVVFGKEFLAKGMSMLEKKKQTLLLAQYQDGDNSPPQETGFHVDLKKLTFSNATSSSDINCLSTRGLFLKWADFVDIGGFHPTILPHYFSDYEFTIRAHKKGYKCLTSPEVTLSPKLRETGRLIIDYSSYFRLWRSLFSIKAVYNPLYQISFVVLVCPVRWIPRNILRVLFTLLLINFRYLKRKLKAILVSRRIKQDIKK